MAVDQNFVPKDLRSQNPNRNPTTTHAFPFHPSNSSLDDAADEHSSRKVKLLCSFGGKILTRPSDGVLRYAGGQTRIFSVRRDVAFPELYRKMSDAYGGPVVIRYQLPDQDLDALVSVSSADDLDNMMDEYDKLPVPSVEGSSKLRVFLFSPSQVASAAAEISSGSMAVVDPYDSGHRYIEAVNGLAAMEMGGGGIRRKNSTASISSTQNSDGHGDESNNEGASPTVHSPTAAGMASHGPSRVAFVGNVIPEPEYQSFPAKVAAHNLNPPSVAPYASQAYIEPHQVQYITPHSLATEGGPQLLNMVAVPQHPYLSPMHIPPPSVPSHVGILRQVQGNVESHFDENHYGGRFFQLVPDQSYKVFQQPLSQLPPLNPSQMQPQSIEQYGLHALRPLLKGQGIRLEDCLMCQKDLAHSHSDTVINEQGNLSGPSTSEARPGLYNNSSEDIIRLQAQHRAVSVATMENLAEPKVESILTSGQFGAYGVNKIPEQILEKEKLVEPNAESFDHSKSKQPQGPVGLSGDTRPSYGALVNPPQPHHEGALLQQHEVLHVEYFDHAKALHLPATIGLSSTAQTPYGESLGPQPRHEEILQQKKVSQADNFDNVKVLHPPSTMGLTASTQTSYVISVGPPQPHYEDSLRQQQQLPQATASSAFPVKQENQKQLGQDSNSMETINCQAPELVSNSIPRFPLDYVQPVDGMMEALRVSAFENLKSNDQLKPIVVPNLNFSKDVKPDESFLVGDQNHAMRTHNGANVLISSNAFVSPGFVTEGVSLAPVNPMFSNIGMSKDMKPEISSVVGEEKNNARQLNGGNALFSSNAFPIPGVPPEANSVRLINPFLYAADDYMNLHNFQYPNTALVSTTVTDHGLFSKKFERCVEPAVPHDVMVGIAHTDSAYWDANKFPDGERKVEASMIHPKEFNNDIAAIPQENMPFQFSHSSCTPGHMEQFFGTTASDSLFCNQDPWKILGNVHMYPPRPTIVASRESSYPKDMFIENFFPDSKGPDIAVLLEEGVLHPPVDSLNKDSHPEPFIATQDYVKQDLRELAEQVGESVLQSITSAPPLCSLEPNESSPSFNGTEISEDKSSAAVLGDQKQEDIKAKQSDKAHFAVPLADDHGRLQIIKNCDLEELRELGSGTFGTVYHGKWRGSDVAIKRINDRCFAGKPSEQERMRIDFWNEASKLADLHHPNVVTFYGIVLDVPGGSFATVTEYMVNGSLRTAIQSNEKTFDRRKRLLIATDVAFGMEYLHGKNIVHFDLKSDNLLVNFRDPQRPICKVGDLGLSKVKCKTLISGGVRGTLPWMAPELLNGSSSMVSEKVDVFSFGIVMWELLTGQEPYADLHYGTIIGGIVSNTLRPPVPESCDPDWKALMEQCWSAEPSGRPNFIEIASRLRSMAGSLSQKVQTSTQPQPQK